MTPPINLDDTSAQSARRTIADQRYAIRQRINNMSSSTGTCTTDQPPSSPRRLPSMWSARTL